LSRTTKIHQNTKKTAELFASFAVFYFLFQKVPYFFTKNTFKQNTERQISKKAVLLKIIKAKIHGKCVISK